MAEGHNSHDQAQEIPSTLSDRAQVLQALVQDVLGDYRPEMGASIDVPTLTVSPEHIVDVCRTLKDEPRLSFKLLLCLAAVDYRDRFQIVYVLLSLDHESMLMVKTDVPYDDPRLPTVTTVWRGADWYEREAHDLFGVVFDGHPGLKPLILYEGFEGYPGRKDHAFHDYQEF